MFVLKAVEPSSSPVFLLGLKGGFCLTHIGSTLFTVSWNLLFSFPRTTAAGLNRCLCCATCRVDSARFPFGGARPRVELDGQAPPLGRRHSLVELRHRGLEELDSKRLDTEEESLRFVFFFDPLQVLVGCHFVSRRAVTTSDDRHNLQRALKEPSRCRNVSQAAMAPFNFNYTFPLDGFPSFCSKAQRLIFTVSNTLRFLFVLKARRFHIWMFVRQQRCVHLATKDTPILANYVIN